MVAEVERRGYVSQVKEQAGCPRQPRSKKLSQEARRKRNGIQHESDSRAPVDE